MLKKLTMFALVAAFVAGWSGSAQQLADTAFEFPIEEPAYPDGYGPLVLVDEAHFNFHTIGGRFQAFAELLRADGYRVEGSDLELSKELLETCRIFVISNPLPSDAAWNTYPDPTPSAFSEGEIAALKNWVDAGGSLLLIADHMPVAGAALKLAAAFDVQFNDGFAFELGDAPTSDWSTAGAKPTLFARQTGTLADHPITNGRDPGERVDSIRTFTGQAFQSDAAIYPLMVFSPEFVSLMPRFAWQFDEGTRRVSVDGWYQGAALEAGAGRAAFFGEAAMFTAQVAGAQQTPMGMNAPMAEQNPQFVLNVLHWLSGDLN